MDQGEKLKPDGDAEDEDSEMPDLAVGDLRGRPGDPLVTKAADLSASILNKIDVVNPFHSS